MKSQYVTILFRQPVVGTREIVNIYASGRVASAHCQVLNREKWNIIGQYSDGAPMYYVQRLRQAVR